MKTKNLLQTVLFVMAFVMMNQFANAGNSTRSAKHCNCSGPQVGVYLNTVGCWSSDCVCGPTLCSNYRCVKSTDAASYLNAGWSLCSSARLSADGLVENASVMKVYPNPVSITSTISFSLEQSQQVSLQIFDINGSLVATIADKVFGEGVNEIEWNATALSSGFYFVKMQAGSSMQMQKLIVTK